MGCVWSDESNGRCINCNRKEINGLVLIDHVCEICIHKAVNQTARTGHNSSSNGPYFGKFRCASCMGYWTSRFCWLNKYQFCKRCRIPVYPYYHRELRSTDINQSNNTKQEHQKELCEMCQQLGYSCNRYKYLLKP